MYARRQARPKPQRSRTKKWTAPTSGWIANRALADPRSIEGQGAAILDNFFPGATSVRLRRGKQRWATLENLNLPVRSLFTYHNGSDKRLFGANDDTIYDLTSVAFPDQAEIVNYDDQQIVTEDGDYFGWGSTEGLNVAGGFTAGEWSVAQFATTGGTYLIGVNGADDGFLYDGTDFYPYVDGGTTRLDYDGEVNSFTEGDTVTGGTSSATAHIWQVVATGETAGYLLLTDVSGTFEDNETITDTADGEASVNGEASIAAPGITFPGDTTTPDMAYVWVFKNRLFFAEKDSMNAWYLPIDSIGGTADVFPLAGVFTQGGSLLFGSAWSLDSSGSSGLSEQCVFVSSIGEVAVYQGDDPDSAGLFVKSGLYRIGAPLGRRAFFRGGGDIAIATSVGLVPLSKAITLDVTALNVATVSYKIADAWSEALTLRGAENWLCEIWPEGKMAVIAPPDIIGSTDPVMFISNTETGAWARYTGWFALCMTVFDGKLYFGSDDGRVFIANVGGNDDGETYSGAVMPLYEDFEAPASLKIGTVARARSKANVTIEDKIELKSDFDLTLPVAPNATGLSASNTWDSGIWGQTLWGATSTTVMNQDWRSAGGTGYSVSLCYQITSGAIAPLDAELVDLELLYSTAGSVT